MDFLANLSDMDSPEHPRPLNAQSKNVKNVQNASINSASKTEERESTKTPRSNRPGAARPRVNRRPDLSYSNEVVHKTQDSNAKEMFMDTEGKKRKSGTKSRMAMREKQKEEAMKVIRGKNTKVSPKKEPDNSPITSAGKGRPSKPMRAADSQSSPGKKNQRGVKQPVTTKNHQLKQHRDNASPARSIPGHDDPAHSKPPTSGPRDGQGIQVDPYRMQNIKRPRTQV